MGHTAQNRLESVCGKLVKDLRGAALLSGGVAAPPFSRDHSAETQIQASVVALKVTVPPTALY